MILEPARRSPVLAPFLEAGVLDLADVHLASVLARLADEDDPRCLLALALAARAPRFGHTTIDLGSIAQSVIADGAATDPEHSSSLDDLLWPEAETWTDAVDRSPLVSVLPDRRGLPDPTRPLVLSGGLLSLQHYWAHERLVAELIGERLRIRHTPPERSSEVIATLLGDGDEQLAAVETALGRSLTVLVGGPGTGKTTAVAALLAALVDPDGPAPLDPTAIALAAPTGKAAARLGEAVRHAAGRLPDPIAALLAPIEAATIHRLLGLGGERRRYHRGHPLPQSVVVVDESSMISLPLMSRLLDAVRPDARLVLVGDPDQLTSVEAGSVLADLVVAGDGSVPGFESSVVTLRRSRRFAEESALGRFAAAIRSGDADAVIDILADGPTDGLEWISGSGTEGRSMVMPEIVPVVRRTIDRARDGDAAGALDSLAGLRVLCAHRRGPWGASQWNRAIEAAVGEPTRNAWYPGRPVMVTRNDYRLDVFNGDIGVVIDDTVRSARRRVLVAFPDLRGSIRLLDPVQLGDLETVHAMTIHKSQGSEFDHVIVVLPPVESRLASRELLYTAVTRARRKVTVIGTGDMVRAAVERRVIRASGLGDELRLIGPAV